MPANLTAEPIDESIFRRLLELAALEVPPAEADYLRRELNAQLAAIRELEAIPLPEDLPITSHGVPYGPPARPPLRPDEIRPSDLADAILAQAPKRLDRYLVVPDLPRTELE